jgi:hypothetical protein
MHDNEFRKSYRALVEPKLNSHVLQSKDMVRGDAGRIPRSGLRLTIDTTKPGVFS